MMTVLILSSCKKQLQLSPSPVLIEKEKIVSDDQTATAAILGVYVQMMNAGLNMANGGLSVYPALSADELYNTASSTAWDPFTTNALTSNNTIVNTAYWRPAYSCLYQLNALIEELEKATAVSATVKEQLLGEAHFTRAWIYCTLINLFGEVPLVLTTDYKLNAVLPKAPVNQIYDQVIADLQLAKSKLKENYPTAGRVRPNKWSAVALLARVYLYNQNWQLAETEASAVINAGMYQLLTDLNTVFLSNNNEAIWQLLKDNNNTAEAATFIPASATVKPTLAVTDQLLNTFETGDKRKLNWLKANTISSQLFYYPNKYKARTSTPLTETKQLLRLAEQYLIRGEARVQLNKLDSAKADLNIIRSRAGLLPIIVTTQTDLMKAVEKERQTELFAEDGHRWFDLKRWNKATTVLAPLKTAWLPTAIRYPIPLTELERNPFLLQNPGY